MNANDESDAEHDSRIKLQLEKVEAAIEHEVKSLANLFEIRDALRAELGK